MSGQILAARDVARRILDCEADIDDCGRADAGRSAIEKLRLYLTKFVGAAGFHALLSRALALARRQAPSLESVQVTPDGTLAGFDEAVPPGDREAGAAAALALLEQLIGLLVTFIGEPVTVQMVRDVWPNSRLNEVAANAEEVVR
jgi:hypothetical protein